MLKFLFFSALVLAAVTIGAPIFFSLLLIFGVLWLITLPIRLVFGMVGWVFHLIFALIGLVLGVVFAPVMLVFAIPAMILWTISRLFRLRPFAA